MQRLKFTNFTDFLAAALCIVVAISLQIQVTLFQSPDYLGLRINLTDLFIIPVGLAILATLLLKQSLWPAWRMKHVYLWLLGLTGILAFALIHTHYTFGEISRWALVNKFGGWFILLALMGMGAWIVTNARREWIELFLKTFLYVSLAVLVFEQIYLITQSYPWWRGTIFVHPYATGLMANRNAYGLLFIATICLATCLYFSDRPLVKSAYFHALYFLLPFFIMMNASRAVYVALGIVVPAMLIFHCKDVKKLRNLLIATLIGIAVFFAIFHDKKDKLLIFKDSHLEFLNTVAHPQTAVKHPGDSIRYTILSDAKEMIPAHPVLGSGLGSALLYQEQKHGKIINLIDCTALWLLVETGLIGFLAFAAFYVQTARTVHSSYTTDEDLSKTFQKSLLFMLVGFTAMSLLHEIMYTRFIWFFLGFGLAMPSRMRQDV